MDESTISSFAMWAGVTAIVMLVTGFTYRAYLRKRNHEISSS